MVGIKCMKLSPHYWTNIGHSIIKLHKKKDSGDTLDQTVGSNRQLKLGDWGNSIKSDPKLALLK